MKFCITKGKLIIESFRGIPWAQKAFDILLKAHDLTSVEILEEILKKAKIKQIIFDTRTKLQVAIKSMIIIRENGKKYNSTRQHLCQLFPDTKERKSLRETMKVLFWLEQGVLI